jgi:D-aminoacyl-tRNA deacylase
VSSNRDIVFIDNLDDHFGDCNYIFISRHRAESGIPSLTGHFPGNFGNASFGGSPREIAKYSPSLLKKYMIELYALREMFGRKYEITLEATHHGPTGLRSPVMFVELGSTSVEWSDVHASKLIAKALVDSLESPKEYHACAIGIGGTHYPEKLNRFEMESEIALGPIVPKYSLEFFDRPLLDQMISKSDQKITHAIVDRKGLGRFKENVTSVLRESKLETINA